VCGVPIENAKEIRRIIGYLPQEFSMYPSMKVGEAMKYLAILSGLSGSQRKERIDALLKKVNLTEHRDKKVKALSGGMKRRLGIAQALLNNPKVLIVDEPTAGLDPEERVRFRNLLSEIAEDKIVILSTHIVGDIEATCEDIAIINEGRVIYNGTVDALLQEAEGRVFTMTASKRELPELKRQLSITSMHTQGNKVHIRFIADNLMQGAKTCEPNIEDAYMLYLHTSGVREILGEIGGEW
jgi:ABC-2 type transport system ATP-binding protein